MSFSNITQEDLVNRGVTGLPDTPNLSTADMQRKFDELSLDVVIPKFNKLLEDLVSATAAANIGAKAPEGMTGETVQALLDSFYTVVQACETAKHGHENIEVLDAMTADIYTNIDHIIALLGDITNITDTVTGSSTEIPTGKAIAEYIQVLGGGDMLKSIYDPDGDGIVKGADVATNAEKLGGQLPGYYQPVTADELETAAKTIVGAINEVNAKIDNAEVDTLTTMEQVEAATDSSIPVGAGAIKELNESLTPEDIDTSNWTVNYGIEIISAKYYPSFKKVEIKFRNGDTGYAHDAKIITGIDDKYCPEKECYIGSILGRTSTTTLAISRGLLSTDGTITAKHLTSGSLTQALCNGFWYVK